MADGVPDPPTQTPAAGVVTFTTGTVFTVTALLASKIPHAFVIRRRSV